MRQELGQSDMFNCLAYDWFLLDCTSQFPTQDSHEDCGMRTIELSFTVSYAWQSLEPGKADYSYYNLEHRTSKIYTFLYKTVIGISI
jgi:hypothetical protein